MCVILQLIDRSRQKYTHIEQERMKESVIEIIPRVLGQLLQVDSFDIKGVRVNTSYSYNKIVVHKGIIICRVGHWCATHCAHTLL